MVWSSVVPCDVTCNMTFTYLFICLFLWSLIQLLIYIFSLFHTFFYYSFIYIFTFVHFIGDVLSALSRNAMAMAQQSRAANQQVQGLSQPARTPLSLVPVPYRNSKLTHLLKGTRSPMNVCYILLMRCIVYTSTGRELIIMFLCELLIF